MRIVVMNEGCNRPLEMLLVHKQQPIEALCPNRANKSLRHSVGLRRSIRGAHDLDAFRSEYLVEAVGKLLIPISDQESKRSG